MRYSVLVYLVLCVLAVALGRVTRATAGVSPRHAGAALGVWVVDETDSQDHWRHDRGKEP